MSAEAVRGSPRWPSPGPGADIGIDISRAGAHVVVALVGALDATAAGYLDHVLVDLVAGQGNGHVDIDLSGLDSFDAAGLAVVVAAERAARRHGSWIRLLAVPPPAEETLRALGHCPGPPLP